MSNSTMDYDLLEKLSAWDQDHLVALLTNSHPPIPLVEQLKTVDYPALVTAVQNAEQHSHQSFAPPDGVKTVSDTSTTERKGWWLTGLKLIAAGKAAACVLAGGQGTRMGLGPDESKGMLRIGLDSGVCVFEIFVGRLSRLKDLACKYHPDSAASEIYLPLLIMTSPLNDSRVRKFFEENNNFGYPMDQIIFFQQGTLPALTYPDLKLMLDSPSHLAESPDGNGGVHFALSKTGVLDTLINKGVEFLHVFAVDNPLTRPVDPALLGYCVSAGAEVGNKVVWKTDWKEKVGVLAKRDGKTSVVEYSDLYNPDIGLDNPMIRETDDAGRLLFGAGNICNHMYSLGFIKRILPELKSMFHVAHKKVPFFDPSTGNFVKPERNNAVKLESFIFDAFELSRKSVVLECLREEEFAPMKNPTGADSPESALALIHSAFSRVNLVRSNRELPASEFYFGEEILN